MYESAQTDLLVKYYDQAFGKGSDYETKWYLDRIEKLGGPILDLACGTGRMTILVAEKGLDIIGIDASAGMLDIFRSKLKEQASSTQERIRIEEQQMHNFTLQERFSVILCCDAFFHNMSVVHQLDCLNCVNHHLLPGGRFLFNLPYPTCSFIDYAEASKGHVFTERGRFELKDSSTLVVEHAQSGDRLNQTITTTHKISRYDKDDVLLESGISSWQSRYLYPYEAIHLLYRCGFEVESVEGSYKGDPMGEGRQLIFQARKNIAPKTPHSHNS